MISLSKARPRGAAPAVVGAPLALPRVNLLPPEIEAARRFRRVQAGLGSGVLAAVGVVALLFVGASGSVADAQGEVDAAAAQQQVLTAESARYRDVTATYQRASQAQALLTTAMGQEVRYSRFLNDLALTVPDGVWVTSLGFTQAGAGGASGAAAAAPAAAGIGTVAVSGTAYAHEDVAVWLESLAGQDGYVDPLLQSSTERLIGRRKVVDWSTTVTLSPDALSGRYAKPGS